jgi:hypothetical protein
MPGVVVFGPAIAAQAFRALRTADLVGTEILGAIQGDQHMLACPAKRGQAVRSLQFRQHRGKHRMQQRRRDWVQHIADMVVARNPSQSEQALAVRPSVALPQLTLMRQEGWALHKEHRERGHPDIGDRIDRVHPPALVGERLAALAQAAEKGLEVFHPLVESYPAPVSEPYI